MVAKLSFGTTVKSIVTLCALLIFSCKDDLAGMQVLPQAGKAHHALSSAPVSGILASDTTLRVLSYNIYEGFRKDSALYNSFRGWVRNLQPDIIGFQELNGFTGDSFRQFAKELGFPYTVMLRKSAFPMGLASKYPITGIEKIMDGMRHGCLRAKVLNRNVYVTHLEPNDYNNRHLEIEIIKNSISQIPATEKIMLMGDLNNMSPQDSLAYQNEAKMQLVRQSEANNPAVHILNNGKIDYYALQAMFDINFYDSWKLFRTGYDKSAPTKVRNHNNYTRIDYILVNEALKADCRDAYLIKDSVTDYLSDHYPMFMILKK